jgi:hypothetical protein
MNEGLTSTLTIELAPQVAGHKGKDVAVPLAGSLARFLFLFFLSGAGPAGR